MFTEILSVVVLLAIPIVVIVHPTFGWLLRSDLKPLEASQRFYMRFFRFFRFPQANLSLSGHQMQAKSRLATLGKLNVGGSRPNVWPVLLARPTVVLLLLLTIRTVFSSQRLEALIFLLLYSVVRDVRANCTQLLYLPLFVVCVVCDPKR